MVLFALSIATFRWMLPYFDEYRNWFMGVGSTAPMVVYELNILQVIQGRSRSFEIAPIVISIIVGRV